MTDDRPSFNWHERIARRKLSLPDEWEACIWKVVGDIEIGDTLVTLGIPRLLKSGKRKGQRTWRDSKLKECVVTRSELEAAFAEYEREGRCFDCYGTGQKWAAWSSNDGHTFTPCRRCDATGKPKSKVAA